MIFDKVGWLREIRHPWVKTKFWKAYSAGLLDGFDKGYEVALNVSRIAEDEPFGWLAKLVDDSPTELITVKKEALQVLLGQFWYLNQEYKDPGKVRLKKFLAPLINDLLYDFYAHLENCPGVDLNGIWEAIATYKPKE